MTVAIGTVLAVSLVVGYLNSEGEFGFLATRLVKASVGAALIGVMLLGAAKRTVPRPINILPLAAYLLYFVVISIATLIWQAGISQWFIFAQALSQLMAMTVLMVRDADVAVRTIFYSALAHCLLAIVGGREFADTFFAQRASGGSHPILIGFASLIVLALVGEVFRRRTLILAASGVAMAALYLSFSRTAIVAFLVTVGLVSIFHRDRFRHARLLAVGLILAVAGSVVLRGVLDFLANGDEDTLLGGTGRTEIWSRILSVSDDFLPFGLGFGGTNSRAFGWISINEASFGQPAENSLLEAAIYGGYASLALLLVVIVSVLVVVLRSRSSLWFRVIVTCTVVASTLTTSGFAGLAYQSVVLLWFGLRPGSYDPAPDRHVDTGAV